MANHDIPRTAEMAENLFGLDDDGNVVRVKVYRHRRAGHTSDMWYVLWYRERNRRIDRSSRITRQYSGHTGKARLDAEMTETRRLLAQSLADAGPRRPAQLKGRET